MKTSGIYKIVNISNGKYYVGSSNDIEWRTYNHFRKLKLRKHENPHLQSAWNLYGESMFEVVVVEKIARGSLLLTEQKYLDVAKTDRMKCYNQTFVAGCGPGHTKGVPFSDAHIKSLSQSHKGQKAWNEGKNKETNPSVKRMSDTKQGKVCFARSYTFVSPTTEIVHIHNLKQHCRDNNLTYTTMVQLARGNRYKSHKGWKQYV